MKSILFILLFFCNSVFAQINSFIQTSENQLQYVKSYSNELLDENGSKLNFSYVLDTLVFTGIAENDYFGSSISSAGDVNGDGYNDIIVGAYGNNSGGFGGKAYIFLGGAYMNNIADVTFMGEAFNNYFGYTVSSAGDVNNDGFSDVIIGANEYNLGTGRAYIFYGGTVMNNVADVILNGESSGYKFGYSVSIAGDVNNDGYSDVIVGEKSYALDKGRAYIFYGGSNMDNLADVIMTGEAINNYFSLPVSTAGDVNNDGFSDVIIGAYGYNSETGKVYIYYGGVNMNNIPDVTMTGEATNNYFNNVSTAGDVNNDGYSDVIIGAWGYNGYKGKAYIYFGGSNMDDIADLTISGENYHDNFGTAVSTAGDINNDGFSDVIIGANGYNSGKGKSYIYYGALNMDTIADVTLLGETNNNYFGSSVSTAGDVNNNKFSDVLIGAFGYYNNTGRAYLFKKEIMSININLKVLVEGMYYPLFNQTSRKDTIKVTLREASSPYLIRDSSKSVIDSITFTGLYSFPNAETGNYYIVVNHFNSLETWSKSGGEYLINNGSIYNYDFTTSVSQTYGNNMTLKGNKYCIYSGDVIQDGFIDGSDFLEIDNDAFSFREGNFIPSDLNASNNVDGFDLQIGDNNRSKVVITP